MNNFKDGGFKKRGGDFGGRPKFGGGTPSRGRKPVGKFGGDRGGRSDRPMELFSTTCSACKKSCEVPFRPNSDKPVYCSACFGKKNSDDARDERGEPRSEFRPRNDFRSERSEYAKPQREYQASRTEAPRKFEDNGLGEIKKQLATIESRLNRILDLINPPVAPTKAPHVEVSEIAEGGEEAPKKVRKPKTVKTKTPAKKSAKKAVKKGKK